MDEHGMAEAHGDAAKYLTPLIIRPLEVADFTQQVIKRCPPKSEIVVCCTEEELVYRLLASIEHIRKRLVNDEDPDDVSARGSQERHVLLDTTLRQLHTTSKIKMTFCHSLDILQAYVASHGLTNSSRSGHTNVSGTGQGVDKISSPKPHLILLNPLSLHYETANFSAQGVSRTFASAVDAAFRSSLQLIIAECPGRSLDGADEAMQAADEDMHDDDVQDEDPWEHEVPILNTTVKSFGGDRTWTGRTVSLRQVAQRWFDFVDWND